MSSENLQGVKTSDLVDGESSDVIGDAGALEESFEFDLSLDLDEALGVPVPAQEDVRAEDAEAEQQEGIEERGVDGMPLVDAPVPESASDPTVPAYDRIKRLLAEMGSQRKTLLAMIAACEQPLSSAAMVELVEELQRYNRSVYTPSDLCNLLHRDGALDLVNEDGSPYVEDQEPQVVKVGEDSDSAAVADSASIDGATAEVVDEQTTPDASADLEPCEADEQLKADEGAASCDKDTDGDATIGEQPDGEHVALEPAKPAERYWLATSDGLRVVRENDPAARLEQLFEDETRYLPIYKCLLQLCARDGGARTPALSAAVNDHELLQHPRYFVTRFVDRLERCEALEWRGSWVATQTGLAGLEQLGDVEDIEVAQDIDEAQEVRFGYYTNEDLDALQA